MFPRQLAPLLMLLSVALHAADESTLQLKQLDDKVQSLKSRVLELNTDIDRVEQVPKRVIATLDITNRPYGHE